jgi:hypothetical protein
LEMNAGVHLISAALDSVWLLRTFAPAGRFFYRRNDYSGAPTTSEIFPSQSDGTLTPR